MAQNPGGGYPPPGFPVGNNGELHQTGYPSQSPQQTSPFYPDPSSPQDHFQAQSVPPLPYLNPNCQQNPIQAQSVFPAPYPYPNSQQNPFSPHLPLNPPQSLEQLFQQNPQFVEELFQQNPQFIKEYFLQNPQFMEKVFRQHPQFMEHVFRQHPQFMEQVFQQHPQFMEQVFQQHPQFTEHVLWQYPQFMAQVFQYDPHFMEHVFRQHPQFMEWFSQQHPQFMEQVFQQHPQFMEQVYQQHPQFMERFSQQHPQFMEQFFRQQAHNPQFIAPQSFPQNSHQSVEQYSQHHSADPQQFQSNSQHYPSPYDDPKLTKPLRLNIQEGKNEPREMDIHCHGYEFFQWAFCISNNTCLESMKKFLYSNGIGLAIPQNKAPLFMFPLSCNINLLVNAFRDTSQRHGVVCEPLIWDFSKSEEDVQVFCINFVKNERPEGILLLWELKQGIYVVQLCGIKAAVDLWRPSIDAEIQKEKQKHVLPEPEPFKISSFETKILHEMKTKLEAEFQVQISFESDKMKITPTTQESIDSVFKRIHEMLKSCRMLPFSFRYFLLHQERAKLHIENEIEKLYSLKVHLLVFEEDGVPHLLAFEENGKELGEIEKAVSRLLFLIPSEDTLCQQIFSTESGKALFSQIVEENEGKLRMIYDERQQMCCVGTIDIEEKIKKRLLSSLTSQEFVELPSEQVWNFCKKHWQFEDIQKNFNCEVNLAQDVELPWAIEIKGQTENVSCCHQRIAMEVKKIDTKQIQCLNFTNGSDAHLIEKLNEEKRCLIDLRTRQPIPWKKWIEGRGLERSLTYSISFDTITVIKEDDLKITLLTEEQSGATSKEDCQYLHADWVQVFVPPMSNTRKKTTFFTKITNILTFNSEKMGKRNILIDCKQLQEEELRYFMKLMCDILNERVGKDLEILKCEFHDTRQEMFCWMTEIIDKHLSNKNVNVFEWKGRTIDMDVQEGQLAQQQGFDVLVNSTSPDLYLNAGYVSKKILEMAGPEIQAECKKYYKGGIKVGKVAITKGYNLKCEVVFHGCLDKYNPAAPGKPLEGVRIFVRNCLKTSDKLKMESIAFPALGTGNLGYSREAIANIIFEEVEKYQKEFKAGSLSRVCCVIPQGDIDSIRDFQKRLSIWKKDHQKEVYQELVVTTDDPKVLEEIYQEVQNLQGPKLTEPPDTEISKTDRLGVTPIEGAVKNVSKNMELESRKRSDSMLEERLSILLKMKEPNKHGPLEAEVRKDFRDLAENIVCPFDSDDQALLQFSSEEGINRVYKMERLKRKYVLGKFPEQAVVDLRAAVSPKMVKLLKERGITEDLIRQKSGVTVDEKESDNMVLCGNILEIKAAFDFLSSLLKKPLKSLGQQTSAKDNPHKPNLKTSTDKTNHLKQVSDGGKVTEEAKTVPEQLKQYENSSLKLSQVSFTPSMAPSTQSVRKKDAQKRESETVESDIYQPSYAEKDWKGPEMQYTYEDYIKLKHFSKSMLGVVKEAWSPKKTMVTIKFANDGHKADLESMLQKIHQMSRKTIAVQSKLEFLEEILQQKCSNDLFCYLTKDNEIEIIGNNERIVDKAKKELEELLAFEIKTEEEEQGEERLLPVFFTNEGVSVFVYHGSLLTAEVDAIVCPISNKFELHGLQKSIAEMAGPAYKKEVEDIRQRHKGKLPEEFICIIPGGEIPSCKFVVNIVTERWKDKEDKKCKISLQFKMLQIFLEAEQNNLQSIALPAICAGKMGYPKEICANCYASSIVKYSSFVDDTRNLKEIHFVDQSVEMITYIESVFTNPDMIEEFEEEEITDRKSNESSSSSYPYMDKDNTCCLNENLQITVVNKDIKIMGEKETFVLDPMSLESQVKKMLPNLKQAKEKTKQQDYYGEFELVRDSSGKSILIVDLPVWKSNIKSPEEQAAYLKKMSLGYQKIFEEAERLHLFHLILPLYGAVEGNKTIIKECAVCFIKELRTFAYRCKSLQNEQFSITMPIKDQFTRDIILKELKVVVDDEQAGFQLPISKRQRKSQPRKSESWKSGDQPYGTIFNKHHDYSLSAFKKSKTIELIVKIPDGTQQSFHPNPGKYFRGRIDSIFLPDNKVGRKIIGLFIDAFHRGILYTISTSRTTKAEMVVPTDIPIPSKRENVDAQDLQKLLKSLQSKISK
ncbi:uncharacterized protein LOC134264598 [Saccostrea cucullata]|uniref:uncharacterized protein LOC134264598 n=1 Tax=Saccostrea cuccullata TaxID=36930 RepID=UPI002ED5E8BB